MLELLQEIMFSTTGAWDNGMNLNTRLRDEVLDLSDTDLKDLRAALEKECEITLPEKVEESWQTVGDILKALAKAGLKELTKMYYILSLKWSKDKNEYVWWQPENNGYTSDLNFAGKYTKEQVETKPDYYNNGSNTLAIPVEVVEQTQKMVVVPTLSDNYKVLGIQSRIDEATAVHKK